MNALIIVDVQNDFLPQGRLAVPEGDLVIPVINGLQAGYDLVVATQDWHPANHLSFASQHPGASLFEKIELDGLEQVLWPDHCIQGTPGAAFAEMLDTRSVSAIFRKGMDTRLDSYSGFFDNGHRKSTGLAAYLRDMAVSEVHVCGLAADFCVFFTAMDSLTAGFHTGILTAATKAIDAGTFAEKLQRFSAQGGKIL
ncbi:bifunctional nicotinamidase/pyrazinamidase [Sphingobacterium oryzagri]|uniref:nicotinamidase n=1 Tax=Sphingobacterium oryzagri TaxID=3025669 RepID=A0ABY7WKT0_9SPHI|nr:bifunctional nicotinamidase/pyrazinamidase [Sphingobacterium sp. KACC 22765]WDF68905.1 bifunctional nicotinamidase/pyrazinamidase [Sphingobacterium sp. KACC 22765]